MGKGARVRAERRARGEVTPQVPGPTGYGAKSAWERRKSMRFRGKKRPQ